MAVRRTASVAPNLNITGESVIAGAQAATKAPTRRRNTAAEKLEAEVRAGAARAAGPKAPAAKKATSPKPPAKKAVPAHVTNEAKAVKKMVPAKKAAVSKDAPKEAQTFEQRDWTYLDDKDPSEQHEILAKEINRRTNLATGCPECETEVPISPKQVQAVLAMFPHFQRSATNKARSGYHALAPEIVEQRSVHMTLAHKDAAEQIAARQAAPAKKATAKRPAKKAASAFVQSGKK